MDYHFLTTKNFTKGILWTIFEKVLKKSVYNPDLNFAGYHLVTSLKKQNKENATSVGLYKNDKRKVIIKSYRYGYKNLLYEQLINQINVLRILSSDINGYQFVRFPKVYEFITKEKTIAGVFEFVEGKPLISFSKKKKISTIKNVLRAFEKVTLALEEKERSTLPKRSLQQVLFSFPIYLISLLMRDSSNWRIYITGARIFYQNLTVLKNTGYVLSHKDLHSKNILISKKRIYVLDTELTSLNLEQTEIAIMARLFVEELGNDLFELLNDLLRTKVQKKRFLVLSIYYATQFMAMSNTAHPEYKDSFDYLKNYLFTISDKFFSKNHA